jgi:hypothetical protein
MRKEIEIGGKLMPFEASAMTDHMADHIFGINVSYAVQHAQGNEYKLPDLIRKIAFVMHKRAVLGGWRKVEELTEDDFCDWLDGLDSYELETKASEIIGLYAQNKHTSISPKNTNSPQAE